jgi:hypothetical protein
MFLWCLDGIKPFYFERVSPQNLIGTAAMKTISRHLTVCVTAQSKLSLLLHRAF